MLRDPDELRVYYGKDAFMLFEHSIEFEAELDQLCKRYGLYRWASGKAFDTGIRDIAYDRAPPE